MTVYHISEEEWMFLCLCCIGWFWVLWTKVMDEQKMHEVWDEMLTPTAYCHKCAVTLILPSFNILHWSFIDQTDFRMMNIDIISRSFTSGWLMLRFSIMPQCCFRTNSRYACVLYPSATSRVIEPQSEFHFYNRAHSPINPVQTISDTREKHLLWKQLGQK